MKLEKIYYFSSTHWDREWYSTFQRYRFRLVDVVDEILDTLSSDPAFTHFTFDGQSVALLDYLEIRPERKDEVCRLLAEGRLSVGPWFTMPDEFIVSGESLIHNLQEGFRVCRSLGTEPMRFGYVCDVFGHIAQLPQILRGFSIGGALLGRGTNDFELDAFFNWVSPDGSGVTTYRVPESMGYGCFCAEVLWTKKENGERGDEETFARAEAYVRREASRTRLPYVVIMDGMDHEKIHPEAVRIARHLEKTFGCEVVFDSLESLAAAIDREALDVKRGELNRTAKERAIHNKLITHTLSSRIDLKRANAEAETLLEKFALPLRALANASGAGIPRTFCDSAYRYLLLNHAHDSICGCGIDEIHRDMLYRYRQATQIAAEVADRAATYLSGWTEADGAEDLCLTLVNPLPYAREETVTAEIQFPVEYPCRYFEQTEVERINSFKLLTPDGAELPYRLLSVKRNTLCPAPDHGGNRPRDLYRVAVRVSLPACGFIKLRVVPSPLPSRYLDKSVRSALSAENEYLRLSLNGDGTFDIEDKRTGKAYRNLCSYLDDGELGDGWFHYAPVGGGVVSSRGGRHTLERLVSGESYNSFRITSYLDLPARADFGRELRRSEERREVRVATELSLGCGPRVEVDTVIYNTAEDHRLKVILPVAGADPARYTVGQAFCFLDRPAGIEPGTDGWNECAKPEKQFADIALRRGPDGCGLAFLSAGGLHEVTADDDKSAALEVTLLRCFKKTVGTDGQSDGQLLGPVRLRYALMPLTPADTYAGLVRQRDAVAAGVLAMTGKGSDALSGSFLRLCGEKFVLSCAEETEDGISVRIYNCSDEAGEARLTFFRPVLSARLTDLEGKTLAPLTPDGCAVALAAGPWQIATVRVTLAEEGGQ